MSYTRDAAETLALTALGWLAAHNDLLPVFMGATGIGESDLRQNAANPDFLGGVLDFLMMDDAWIMRFCDDTGTPYDAPAQARAALPGGAQMHWT